MAIFNFDDRPYNSIRIVFYLNFISFTHINNNFIV